jgi:type III secretion system chaperone SycN
MISTALDELGARIGLDPSVFAGNGHIALKFGELEEVHFEPREETLVMYVSRAIDVGRDRLELFSAALRAVHYDNRLPARVQCALHEDKLVFLAQYDSDEVDLPELEKALELLSELHSKVNQ